MKPTLHRPEPIQRHSAQPVTGAGSAKKAAHALAGGDVLVVTDTYSTGAEILAQLKSVIQSPGPNASYADRQRHAREYRAAALRLLAPISEGQVPLSGGRRIGFLRLLYPELNQFYLPFIVVQELHGAWGRYQEGVHLNVLGHKLHPFFGTYVPTRVSHLELFGTWLSQYGGERGRAIDVGTGCGVLALMMAKSGFQHVRATDCNPNAVRSLKEDLERLPRPLPVEPVVGDLLCGTLEPQDLIVFNPPWMQGQVDDLLDRALVFEDGLFERFFDQAIAALGPSGRIVLVFSTVIQLVQPDVPHPILAELDKGRLELVQKLHRKVKPGRDAQGRRRRTREKVEIWELSKA